MSYLSTVLADSPAGYWKLDDAAGTTAVDSSGNGHDGTYENTPTLGVTPLITTGNAVTFNGSTQDVAIPGNAAFNPLGAISLEAWIKTGTAAVAVILAEQTGSGGGDKFLLRLEATHTIGLTLWDNGDNAHAYAGAVVVNNNARHHVVGTYDGATMRVYIDGAADGAGLAIGMTLESATATFQIGVRKNNIGTRSNGFAGTIDEVAIYPTALSAARVLAHYNAGISTSQISAVDGLAYASVATVDALAVASVASIVGLA